MPHTIAGYAARWLDAMQTSSKPNTYRIYECAMRVHIIPSLGDKRLRDLRRADVRAFVIEKRRTLEANSVRSVVGALRLLLNDAIEDELIASNPVNGINRRLRLHGTTNAKAMTRAEVRAFLQAADVVSRPAATVFWVLARAGLRIGEALALQPAHLDLEGGRISVRQTIGVRDLVLPVPKTDTACREVDMTPQLLARLRSHLEERQRWVEITRKDTPWVFHTTTGYRLEDTWIRRVLRRVATLAGLPPDYTPHSLRHTYASLLVSDGAPLEYVRRQLGHASIKITADLYGRHLPMNGKNYVLGLDD